jgi:hypothetical protein
MRNAGAARRRPGETDGSTGRREDQISAHIRSRLA